jgi:capsid protein
MRRSYEKEELRAARLGATLSGSFKTSADWKAIIPELTPKQRSEVVERLIKTYEDAGTTMDWPVSSFLNLPPLTEAQAFDTKHPHAGFAQHRMESLKGQGRSLRMPEFVATGSAATYNYASVQKDSQWWSQHRDVFRQDIELNDLRPTFNTWINTVMFRDPKLKPLWKVKKIKPKFYWKQEEHADPVKQATSLIDLLRAGILSPSDLMMAFGKDPEDQKSKVKKEFDEMKGYMIFDNGVSAPLPDQLKLAETQAKARTAGQPAAGGKPKPKATSKAKPKAKK